GRSPGSSGHGRPARAREAASRSRAYQSVRLWDGGSRVRSISCALSPVARGTRFATGRCMGFLQDLRFAVRSLARRPGFALVTCLALGLGIGANTAIFTVVNAAVLRPLPYANADRVVVLYATARPSLTSQAISGGDFVDLRAQARSFSGMAAFRNTGFNLTGGEVPERLDGAVVS